MMGRRARRPSRAFSATVDVPVAEAVASRPTIKLQNEPRPPNAGPVGSLNRTADAPTRSRLRDVEANNRPRAAHKRPRVHLQSTTDGRLRGVRGAASGPAAGRGRMPLRGHPKGFSSGVGFSRRSASKGPLGKGQVDRPLPPPRGPIACKKRALDSRAPLPSRAGLRFFPCDCPSGGNRNRHGFRGPVPARNSARFPGSKPDGPSNLGGVRDERAGRRGRGPGGTGPRKRVSAWPAPEAGQSARGGESREAPGIGRRGGVPARALLTIHPKPMKGLRCFPALPTE